jgi:predicted HTH domain antitoxin
MSFLDKEVSVDSFKKDWDNEKDAIYDNWQEHYQAQREREVIELLRRHNISQGRAAELLGITRWDLFDLMAKYKVPAIDMTPEEVREELRKPFPARKQEPKHE